MPPTNSAIAQQWAKLSQGQRDEVLKQMTPEEAERLASEMGWEGHATGIRARPGPFTIAGMKDRALELVRRGSSYLPTIGGIAGGLIGGTLGTPADVASGPVGTAAGAIAGSGVGGAAGEVARQGVLHATGLDRYDTQATSGQRALSVYDQGMMQAGSEAIGQGVGRMLRPTLQRTISKLYYAGGLGAHDNGALESVFNDIAKTERLTGNQATTVGGFLKLLDTAKGDIGNEVDLSLAQKVSQDGKMIPLGSAKADTTPIADRIKTLLTAHPSDQKWNPAKLASIRKRAAMYSTPETFRNLTDRRIILNDHLAALYSLPAGEQRSYLLAHPELEIDKAEADAIRDTVYPAMDRAAKKPIGTTARLQQRRGAIMQLSNTVDKHLDKLQAKTKQIAGAPLWERGNVSAYESSTGRPGFSVHRLTGLIHTPNPERAANKKVASAFGHTVGSKVATGLSSKPGMEVMSLPLRYLATPDVPLGADEETPPPLSLRELRGEAERRKQTRAGPQSMNRPYNYVFDERQQKIIPA
ncbi:MAG TPA: hypothetical protein VMU48_15320 [Terracidiphilus sp.]|nr:hypothetical protein [Terracidiphilus sp.]